MRSKSGGQTLRRLDGATALLVAGAVGVGAATSVAVAARPVAHGLYVGAGTEKVHGEETSHPRTHARFRASDDGKRVSYVRVAYWLPCAKQRWWSAFYAIPVGKKGGFHEHSGAEYEGGPVGEEATYISGRFIKSGDVVRFHFTEQARIYTGHNDPARGHKCARVRINGTARLHG